MRFSSCISAIILLIACVTLQAQDITIDANDNASAIPSALRQGAEEAYAVNKAGLDALDHGNLDSAALCFSHAQSLLPVYSDALNNSGVVHFRQGHISQATMLWNSCIEKDPDYPIAYYNLGVVDFDEKKYENCLIHFNKAISINKKFLEAYIMLGRVELALKKNREGLEHFKAACKIAPNDVDAWQFLSFGHICCGDTNAAQEILKKHLDQAVALKTLGQIASAKKDYKSASEYFGKAIAKGASQELLVDLAMSRVDAGDCKDALVVLKQYAAKVSVQSSDAYLYTGIAEKDCGNLNGAKLAFEKGVALYPADQILRYNLGQIYFGVKQYDQAESMWNTIADSLDDPSLAYLRALNARRKGDFDNAETYVRNAIKRDDRAEYEDLLGFVLYQKGKKDEAIGCFKKALQMNPELRSAQLNLALMTQNTQDMQKASADLEKSLDSCKNKCPDISLALSILLYHQAKIITAAQTLEAVPDDMKNEKIFRHLALYYRDLHDYDNAAKTLEKAKKSFVLDPQTEYELAEDYQLLGNSQKAIEAFKIVLGKWEQNPWRIYYQLGYIYMEKKEFNKAKEYLEQSLKKKPGNLSAQGLMAYIYNAEGNSMQARDLWEKNLKEDPNNFNVIVNMGLSYEKEGKYDDAMRYYQKAQTIKPEETVLQINIGNALMGIGKLYEASKAYSLALNSPKRNLAAYNMFLVAQKSNLPQKAEEMLGILVKEFPQSLLTKRVQADMFLIKQDTLAALTSLESLTEKDPADYLVLAKVYGAKKKFSKANQYLSLVPQDIAWGKAKAGVKAQIAFMAEDYATALSIWKNLGDTTFVTRYNMALAAYNAKNYADAFAIAEKLVGKVTANERADVCRIAGNAAMALKQWEKARQWYQQLENVKKNDPIVEYNLAVISYNLNNIDESFAYYQNAKKLDAKIDNKDIEKRYQSIHVASGSGQSVVDSVDAWFNQGVTFQNDSNYVAAESLYTRVLAKNPGYYLAWNNLGAIYSGRGELEKSLECYLKSIEKQHDIPEAYANLVNVYIALENYKEANRWIIKGRGHNPDSEMLKQLEVQVKSLMKKK